MVTENNLALNNGNKVQALIQIFNGLQGDQMSDVAQKTKKTKEPYFTENFPNLSLFKILSNTTEIDVYHFGLTSKAHAKFCFESLENKAGLLMRHVVKTRPSLPVDRIFDIYKPIYFYGHPKYRPDYTPYTMCFKTIESRIACVDKVNKFLSVYYPPETCQAFHESFNLFQLMALIGISKEEQVTNVYVQLPLFLAHHWGEVTGLRVNTPRPLNRRYVTAYQPADFKEFSTQQLTILSRPEWHIILTLHNLWNLIGLFSSSDYDGVFMQVPLKQNSSRYLQLVPDADLTQDLSSYNNQQRFSANFLKNLTAFTAAELALIARILPSFLFYYHYILDKKDAINEVKKIITTQNTHNIYVRDALLKKNISENFLLPKEKFLKYAFESIRARLIDGPSYSNHFMKPPFYDFNQKQEFWRDIPFVETTEKFIADLHQHLGLFRKIMNAKVTGFDNIKHQDANQSLTNDIIYQKAQYFLN